MNKYFRAVNETCLQNVLREIMAKNFQNVTLTLIKHFEELSCNHSLINRKGML